MTQPRWILRVFALNGEGKPQLPALKWRACTSGDLAKAWGRRWAQDLLRDGVSGVRCNIIDPNGKPWAKADAAAIKPGRLEWTWLDAPSGQ